MVIGYTEEMKATSNLQPATINHELLVIATACLLSIASIFIAQDFGNAFAGRLYWCYGAPVTIQTLAVIVGALAAWATCRFHFERLMPPFALILVGFSILYLPLTETFGYSINGVHRWIGTGSVKFHFPADSVGILLILPQLARWAANQKMGSGETGVPCRIRRWISPSCAFAVTLIAASALLLRQQALFGVILVNSIALLLWDSGRLDRRWKVGVGLFFGLLLVVYALACVEKLNQVSHLSHGRSLRATKYFDSRSLDSTESTKWFGGTKTYRPKPTEFCEYVPNIVRLRFGQFGLLLLALAVGQVGWALSRMVVRTNSLESALQKMALSAYLFVPMVVSYVRTVTGTRLLPAAPFPFLGYGFTGVQDGKVLSFS